MSLLNSFHYLCGDFNLYFMIPKIKHLDSGNFFLLAGPCVIEGEEMALNIAERLVDVCDRLKIPFVFKGSYRKANRSRMDSFSGIGDEKALQILKKVSERFDVPVVTDIHSAAEAAMAAEYVDVLQIPAFLCRQTDLLVAAARTGRVVNIKKGQMLSAHDMRHAYNKAVDSGAKEVWITERGNMFGYNKLVVDFRNIALMRELAPTVIMDCTHAVQRPGAEGDRSGGDRHYIEAMALAAKAFGANGYFFEVHPTPDTALSDGANMLHLADLEGVIKSLL